MHDIVLDDSKENESLLDKCRTDYILPYDVVSAELVDDSDSPFSLILTYIDDYFDKEKMPLIKLNYGDVRILTILKKSTRDTKMSMLWLG